MPSTPTIAELFVSQSGGAGAYGNMDLVYVVRGAATLAEVEAIVNVTAPSTWDDKVMGLAYNVEPVGFEMWVVRVPYEPAGLIMNINTPTEYSFDISAGSEHTAVSIATSASYPAGAPSHSQLINVSIKAGKMSAAGVDYIVPKYDFGQSKSYTAAVLTSAKKLDWANLVGKTNSATFQTMAIGTVLYKGAQGKRTGQDKWDVTHSFSYSPNRTGITIGSITGIAVKGWEYVWVQYEDVEDAVTHTITGKPKYVYVEQLYDSGSFSVLSL
jgi:hypothetical protein